MNEYLQLAIVFIWGLLWIWAAVLSGILLGRIILWLAGARQ